MIMIKINVQNTHTGQMILNVHVTLTADWGTFYNKCQICTFTNNHCECLLFILGGVHCLIVFKVLCTGLIHHCQNYHAYTHTIELESVSGSDVFKFLWNLQKITQIYNIKKKNLKRVWKRLFTLYIVNNSWGIPKYVLTSLGVLSNSSDTLFCLTGSIELNISHRSPSITFYNDKKQPRLWNNCQSQQVLKVQTPSSPTFLNFLASQQRLYLWIPVESPVE